MEAAGETPENQRTTMVRLSTILNSPRPTATSSRTGGGPPRQTPETGQAAPVKPQEDDLRLLMQAVDGDPLEALVWLGLGAGLRRAELLGVRWEDIEYLDLISPGWSSTAV